MDRITRYFNDCFSDNYFVFKLSHKTNVNIDEESDHIETTKLLVFNSADTEDSEEGRSDYEGLKKIAEGQQPKKIAVISKEAFATQYITNFNVALHTPKVVKDNVIYPLIDKKNNIYTERFFEDFVLLRRVLLAHYPTCFIPVLPAKDFYPMQGQALVEKRKYKALREFWEQISEQPHFTGSDIFQAFIDQNCNVGKALDRYLKPSVEEVCTRYKLSFQNLAELPIDENLTAKIDSFESFAMNSYKEVRGLYELVREFQKSEPAAKAKDISLYNELKRLEQLILAGNLPETVGPKANTDFVLHLCDLERFVIIF